MQGWCMMHCYRSVVELLGSSTTITDCRNMGYRTWVSCCHIVYGRVLIRKWLLVVCSHGHLRRVCLVCYRHLMSYRNCMDGRSISSYSYWSVWIMCTWSTKTRVNGCRYQSVIFNDWRLIMCW